MITCVCKVNMKMVHGSSRDLPCPFIFVTFFHTLAYSSTLKMEAAGSSEISTVASWAIWCRILINQFIYVCAFHGDKCCYIEQLGIAYTSIYACSVRILAGIQAILSGVFMVFLSPSWKMPEYYPD
jgi:hypothetical protein